MAMNGAKPPTEYIRLLSSVALVYGLNGLNQRGYLGYNALTAKLQTRLLGIIFWTYILQKVINYSPS
jgi:hypothetical protein